MRDALLVFSNPKNRHIRFLLIPYCKRECAKRLKPNIPCFDFPFEPRVEFKQRRFSFYGAQEECHLTVGLTNHLAL